MDESYCINLCSGLGTLYSKSGAHGGHRFVKNESRCLKSLKRIRKEINLDSKEEKNDSLILFGDVGILRNYLIPLAMEYGSVDETLLTEIAKIAVQLTMPLGPADSKNSTKRLNHLRSFKADFMGKGVLLTFLQLLEKPLASGSRSQNDKMVVELILWLLRNLLAIPDANLSQGMSTRNAHLANLHENFLMMIEREGVLEVLTFLAEYVGSEGNHEWNLIFLEIFYQIFRGVYPEDLFPSSDQRTSQTSQTSSSSLPSASSAATGRNQVRLQQALENASENQDDDLATLMLRSKAKRVQASRTLSSRHSRFSAVLKVTDSVGGKNLGNGIAMNAFAANQSRGRSTEINLTSTKSGKKSRAKKKQTLEEQQKKQQEILLGYNTKNSVASKKLRHMQNSVCQSLIQSCYKPMFSSIKKKLLRDQVLPTDIVQFLWLVALCTGFERTRIEKAGEARETRWEKSPIMKTMDFFTFSYVLKACQVYDDGKQYKELEIALWAFKEMCHLLFFMHQATHPETRLFLVGLRNRVFHDISMELDIVPVLIKSWNSGYHSWRYLCNLCILGDLIVKISMELEEENVFVKHRVRGGTARGSTRGGENAKTGKPWSSEETMALAEAVKMFNGANPKTFRLALRDPTLREIFDKSRTYIMLSHRWNEIETTMKENEIEDIEEFLQHEADHSEANDAASKEEEEDRQRQEEIEQALMERARKEKAVEAESVRKSYINNGVLRNLILLIDPSRIPLDFPESFVRHLHEEVLFPFLEQANRSCPAQLWHIAFFGTFTRTLETYRESRRPKLVALLKHTVSDFFKRAEKNPLMFVELLVWRTKAENDSMLNHYEDPVIRKARQAEERARIAEEEEAEQRKLRGASDEESDDMGVSDEDVGETQEERKKKKKKRRERDSLDDEEEADLDNIGFYGNAKKANNKKGHPSKKRKLVSWSTEETEGLVEEIAKLCGEDVIDLNDLDVLLTLDSMFSKGGKTLDDIKAHLVRLRLPGTTTSEVKGLSASRQDIFSAVDRVVSSGETSALRWVALQLDFDFAVLIPKDEREAEWLSNPVVCNALRKIGFYQDQHSAMWKISPKVRQHWKKALPEIINQVLDNDISMDEEDKDGDGATEALASPPLQAFEPEWDLLL